MNLRIAFPSGALVKGLFTLPVLLLVWQISSGPLSGFLGKHDDQGSLYCDDLKLQNHDELEERELDLIVVVVDFHGSLETLKHQTNTFFSAGVAHDHTVKVIATVTFSLGNYKNIILQECFIEILPWIALQQHLPLPRRFHQPKNWLNSRCLTSVITH